MIPIDTAFLICKSSGLSVSQAVLPVIPLQRQFPISSQQLAQYLTELSVFLIQNLWPNHPTLVPVVSLRSFIVQLLTASKTTASTLQLAIIYLLRMRTNLNARQLSHDSTLHFLACGRRMFLASLLLAYKYLQDKSYSSKAWSKISGLDSAEITLIESEFLAVLDWNLSVSVETYSCWSKFINYHVPNVGLQRSGFPIANVITRGRQILNIARDDEQTGFRSPESI